MSLFDDLSFVDKIEVLKKAGMPIAVINYNQYCVTLYVLDDFFVERYYNCETRTMETIRSAGAKELEKYLDDINIPEVYKILYS